MAVVDASVYVALLIPHEDGHGDAWAWLRGAHDAGEPILAPTILTTEVAAAISRGAGQPALARRAVQHILSGTVVELMPVTVTLSRRAAGIAIDCRLRGADAVYVALAERHRDELVTLDRQQLERGAAVVTTRRPGSLTMNEARVGLGH